METIWEGRDLRGNKDFTLDTFQKYLVVPSYLLKICAKSIKNVYTFRNELFVKFIVQFIVTYNFTSSIASLGILTEAVWGEGVAFIYLFLSY